MLEYLFDIYVFFSVIDDNSPLVNISIFSNYIINKMVLIKLSKKHFKEKRTIFKLFFNFLKVNLFFRSR